MARKHSGSELYLRFHGAGALPHRTAMSDGLEGFQQKRRVFTSAGLSLASEESKPCWSVGTRRWKGRGCNNLIRSAVNNTHEAPLHSIKQCGGCASPPQCWKLNFRKASFVWGWGGVMAAVLLASMALPRGLPCSCPERRAAALHPPEPD